MDDKEIKRQSWYDYAVGILYGPSVGSDQDEGFVKVVNVDLETKSIKHTGISLQQFLIEWAMIVLITVLFNPIFTHNIGFTILWLSFIIIRYHDTIYNKLFKRANNQTI